MSALLLAVAVPLAVTVISYAFFWYEVAGTPHREVIRRRAGGRLCLALGRVLLRSIAAQALAFGSLPLGLLPQFHRPAGIGDGPVVLLVHGLYHSAGGWLLYRRWLRDAGLTNIYAMSYNSWANDIPKLTAQVADRIAQVSRLHPDRPLLLLGHSLGGLLLRAALADPAVAAQAAAVATLSAPLRGSKLAAFGLGPAASGLLYGGAVMSELQRLPAAATPWLCLITDFDNMVLPPQALLPPEEASWAVETVGTLGHVAMLYDRDTAHRAIRFLLRHAG